MTDVFISYAAEDRDRVEALVFLLQEEGLSVWWDKLVDVGKSFDPVIEAALEGAKCVVVFWSVYSIKSAWVKAEASEGLERQILIPVLLDPVRVPLAFRRIQTASLKDWKGQAAEPEIQQIVTAIKKTVAIGPAQETNLLLASDTFELYVAQTSEFDATDPMSPEHSLQALAALLQIRRKRVVRWMVTLTPISPMMPKRKIELVWTGNIGSWIIGRPDEDGRHSPEIDLSGYRFEAEISEHHCRISIENNLLVIEDLGSTKGTFVNGSRIEQGHRVVISNGTSVRFGQFAIFRVSYTGRVLGFDDG